METNRVLSRVGARLLSEDELQQIAGGFKSGKFFGSFNTGACVYDPTTCKTISGDCSDNPPACLGG
jgi:bacteriocin-like protein